MKLYCLLIFDVDYKLTYSKHNLDDFSFIFRHSIKKFIESFANDLVRQTKVDNYYKINDKIDEHEFTIYGSTFNNVCIIITNKDYPQSTAFQLLYSLKNTGVVLDNKKIDELFIQYQNPIEVDKLLKLKITVDEVKIILLDSIDKLCDREEELNSLVDRSNKLADNSIKFKYETEKLNRCCILF
jgi:hypothetical protein